MTKQLLCLLFLVGMVCVAPVTVSSALGQGFDLRGQWVGKAKGKIFGAEGSVFISRQENEDIFGVVEGGNFLGTAKFTIAGKIRGNHIFGQKDGHTFQGFLYQDGTIRGMFRASDGDTYQVFLRRPYPYWGMSPSPLW
ncbi:MAG TPA: hypothetical protein VMC85_02545 [Desulfomonilaceae bacterium]|nr:hypothetical protein [Desulfomonilaceae bacterium]